MADYSLENKVAVITGAAQGIGLAITEEFLKKGVRSAVLLDIKEDVTATIDQLNSKYGPNKAVYFKCDITKDLETVSMRIFEMFKIVDILVNNAGIANENSIRNTMETNAIATMEWSVRFFEHMKENKNGGTIINIASIYGFYIDQFVPIYKASKFAVMGFSKSFGHLLNFKRYGVRVVVVCPGFTNTEIGKDYNQTADEQTQKDIIEKMRNATFQEPEIVGKAVAEVFEKADSGTAWIIRDNGPLTQLP